MKTWGLALLLSVCTPLMAGEPAACTPAELRASQRFWNADGTPRIATYAEMRTPKKCTAGKPRNHYACTKKGSDAVIQFVSENADALVLAASLSNDIYAVSHALRPNASLGRKGRYITNAHGTVHATDEIELPYGTDVFTYRDRDGLVFSVRVFANPRSGKDSVYLAFEGTQDLHTPEGVAAWTGTNIPQQLTAHDAPRYSAAMLAATDTLVAMMQRYGNAGYCDVPMIYTGHSLGGGLALHASLRTTRTNCSTKNNAVVAFNPALSTNNKMLAYPLRGLRHLKIAVILQDEHEPIKEAQALMDGVSVFDFLSAETAEEILEQISSDSQVLLFGDVDADTVPRKANAFNRSEWINWLLEAHSMPRMLAILQDTKHLIGNGRNRLRSPVAQRICGWYTPVRNRSSQ